MLGLEVVCYSEKYEEAHKAFASRMWKARRRREPVYLRWKFRGPQQGPVPGLLLVVRNGEVIGQNGLITSQAVVDGNKKDALLGCDLMVDEKFHGLGVGPMLILASMERARLLLGSDPSPLAESLGRSLDHQYITGPVKMILPLRLEQILSWKLKGRVASLIPFLAATLNPLLTIRNRSLRRSAHDQESTFCQWKELTRTIDEHSDSLRLPHVVHDAEFLHSRCNALPGFNPELSGIRTKSGGWAVVGPENPSCQVYDWVANSFTDCISIIRRTYEFAISNGSDTIRIFANTKEEQQWLSKIGFIAMRRPVKVVVYPKAANNNSASAFRYTIFDASI